MVNILMALVLAFGVLAPSIPIGLGEPPTLPIVNGIKVVVTVWHVGLMGYVRPLPGMPLAIVAEDRPFHLIFWLDTETDDYGQATAYVPQGSIPGVGVWYHFYPTCRNISKPAWPDQAKGYYGVTLYLTGDCGDVHGVSSIIKLLSDSGGLFYLRGSSFYDPQPH